MPPEQEQGQAHNGNEDRSQTNHDMITVVEHFDGIGTLISRKDIETSNNRCPSSIGQNAQDIGYDDGVVNRPLWHIRLTEDHDTRATFRLEQALHCSQLSGLVLRHL